MAWVGTGRRAVLLVAVLLTLPATAALRADDLAPADAEETVKCTEDAMLVLDASGSMVRKDKVGQSLIEGARDAAKAVVPDAARFRNMGLLTLGPGTGDQCANVEVRVPVQPAAATSIIDEVEKLPADGGTPLSRAVETAADALQYRSKPGVMVVISDGDESCGRDPCELARQLKANAMDLTIHVIGFGYGDGPIKGASCLAEVTHGRRVMAKDASELTTALRQALVCPQVSAAVPAITENTGRSTSR